MVLIIVLIIIYGARAVQEYYVQICQLFKKKSFKNKNHLKIKIIYGTRAVQEYYIEICRAF